MRINMGQPEQPDFSGNRDLHLGIVLTTLRTVCTVVSGTPLVFDCFSVNQDFRTPYLSYSTYNLNVPKQKSPGESCLVFHIGYVGSEGRKLSIMLGITNFQWSGSPRESNFWRNDDGSARSPDSFSELRRH